MDTFQGRFIQAQMVYLSITSTRARASLGKATKTRIQIQIKATAIVHRTRRGTTKQGSTMILQSRLRVTSTTAKMLLLLSEIISYQRQEWTIRKKTCPPIPNKILQLLGTSV